jgi:choice-of-anchor A domain-containing protein
VTAVTVKSGDNVLCFEKGADLKNLVITGPATAKVYINVSENLKVSGGKVTLAGELTAKKVIWNLLKGDATLEKAELSGSILASQGKISLTQGSTLYGAAIALKGVALAHNSIISCAKPPSAC